MTHPYDPNAGRNMSMSAAGSLMREGKRLGRLGLSPRQQEMNHLWSYYMCAQYAERRVDWDGSDYMSHTEKVAVASGKMMANGFYDANGQAAPLKFRRPTAPYHLCKVIVDRFTSLLFSEKRHPKISVEADPVTEDFAETVAEEGRLWPTMMQARTFGGATGSVAVGFQFLNGRPYFEVHDPRWVFPYFADRSTLELGALEKRYVFFQEVYDPEAEKYVEVPFWYRRVIDHERDIIFKPAPVGDGNEPEWEVERGVEHGFGFCPVQWIQNLPVVGDIDGLSDCHGTYDMMESVDCLQSQAQRGVIANCDPTLIISSEAEMDSVKTGSAQAIRIPNGSVSYLELSGSGPKSARELAQEYRQQILEVNQCFLEGDQQAGGAMTATEVERRYSSMLAKADVLREQYGERGVKPLLRKVLAAVRQLQNGKATTEGITRYVLNLPPKVIAPANGSAARVQERKLGMGPYNASLNWPRYFEPSLADIQQAVTAAASAKAGLLVDEEHASKFVQEYFQIEDLGKMLKGLKEKQAELDAAMMGGFGGQGDAGDFG